MMPRDVLSSVGCESCHGPGSIHMLNMQGKGPFEGPGIEPGSVDTCMTCHDDFNSPEFEVVEYWERIAH